MQEFDVNVFIYTGEPIQRSAIAEFYDKVEVLFPNLGFLCEKEAMVDITYAKRNWSRYRCEHNLTYLDDYEIEIDNLGTRKKNKAIPFYGIEGMLRIEFLTDLRDGSATLFTERPEDAVGLIEFFRFVCKEFDAIFAIAENWFGFCRGDAEGGRYIDVVEYFYNCLYYFGAPWGSFYFRDDLAERIGLDVLRDWAMTVERVDDVGYHVERTEYPFRGRIEESEIWLEKKKVLFDSIAPQILTALEEGVKGGHPKIN